MDTKSERELWQRVNSVIKNNWAKKKLFLYKIILPKIYAEHGNE